MSEDIRSLEHLDDPRWQEGFRDYLAATGAMVSELRSLGYRVDHAHSLVQLSKQYRDAIPVLIKWLPKTKGKRYKEDIVRALSVPWAKSALPVLFDELDAAGPDPSEAQGTGGYRWAVANAIWVLADDSCYEEIEHRATDSHYGLARGRLLDAMAKTKLHKEEAGKIATKVLISGDRQLLSGALMAVKRLHYVPAKRCVKDLLNDGDPYFRNLAKRVYKALEKPRESR